MNKDINYPVKYAALKLKVLGGYDSNYTYITFGYIASKCYVVESFIKYYPNGDSSLSHKVVFPYSNLTSFISNKSIGNIVTPRYNSNNEIYPVEIISDLFDSYEDAKKYALEKNKEMENSLAMEVDLPLNSPYFNDEYEKVKEKFYDRLLICESYEKLVTQKTEDMKVSINREKCKTLKKYN